MEDLRRVEKARLGRARHLGRALGGKRKGHRDPGRDDGPGVNATGTIGAERVAAPIWPILRADFGATLGHEKLGRVRCLAEREN